MSQHDYIIDDQAGLSFLADLNANLAAIVSNNSGGSEPTVKYPLQWWADTTSDILKLRNEANTAWINVLDLANGAAFLADGAITTDKMQDSAVTNSKIADNTITQAKLAAAIGTSASQSEMEAGTESALRLVSPLRIKQAIAALAPSLVAGGFSNIQVFTSTGTFTVPSGITKVKVTVVGGGGAGGAGNSSYSGSGGGGGGAAIKIVSGLTPGGTVSVTVGGAGGTSSFGAYCSATGGSTGINGGTTAGNGGFGVDGGVGSGGDLNIGGEGTCNAGSYAGNTIKASPGGSSILGGGGKAIGANGAGNAGRAYGGGGSGSNSTVGGAGASGVVIVEY